MKNIPRKLKISLFVISVVVIAAFIAFIISPFAKNNIPEEFNSSRQKSAIIANDIMSLLKNASENINNIQSKEKENGFRSLDIVLKSIQYVKKARSKAVLLASELEKMAVSIPKISPDSARQTAVIAISSEAALINKLISYGDNLNKLLDLLKNKYTRGSIVNYKNVNELIDLLNQNVNEINKFNNQFIKLMSKFDSYYK